MTETLCKCSLFVLVMAYAVGLHGQSAPIPIKSGLWQTTISGTNTVALPPEQEAKIAAMPAAQQAMIRNMSGGGKPTTVTTKSCAAQATSVDALMSQAQQKNTKCTFTNQSQAADGASFDVSCISQQGTASGHAAFHMADSEHVSGTMHMTVDATGRGGAMHMTIDNTITSKYLGADCGTVKPGAAEVVQ
jgi:hypothetical protein